MFILRHIWRHFFLYFFLLVQALFLIWVITGTASSSSSGAQAHAQAVHDCANSGWQGLYKSYNDCVTHLGNAYNDASDVGKGIGVGLVFGLWVGTDVILGFGRLVVALSRRGKNTV